MLRIFYYRLRSYFQYPDERWMQVILLHIYSFFFFSVAEALCYICGGADSVGLLYDKLILSSSLTFFLERPWTIITYAFIQTTLMGLLLNMFMLYTLGKNLRNIYRPKHILRIYFLGQIVGATTFILLYQLSPPFKGILAEFSGPTASIFALLAALCVAAPSLRVYFFFIAVQLRYVVAFLLLHAFFNLKGAKAGYYIAQLGGALVGYVYAKSYTDGMGPHGDFRLNKFKRVVGNALHGFVYWIYRENPKI